MKSNEYKLEFRVYLEDTDAQGIVYHANYLRFFERGRSEVLQELGVSPAEAARPDCRLVVHEIRIRFRRPVFLGERIVVTTSMERSSLYRMVFRQQLRRKDESDVLVSAETDIVAIDKAGTLKELPSIFD
jgi:tol-pal system-associated acyl-CoA thioesterase